MSTIAPTLSTCIWIMLRREVIRFWQQPARLIAALGTTALLWLLLGSGFAKSITPPAGLDPTINFGSWLLPGMMTLVAVFSAIFSSLSTIEDRQTGWLQAVLVSPVRPMAIVLGRAGGGGLVAFLQAIVLLAAIPLIGLSTDPVAVLVAVLAVGLTSLAMAGLGLAFAWRCSSAASFHGVMNLVFVPMWLLSGSVFPVSGAARWLEIVTWCNPLTWCTTAIRSSLLGAPDWSMVGLTAVVAVVSIGVAWGVVRRG